jgi:hypothetical protein
MTTDDAKRDVTSHKRKVIIRLLEKRDETAAADLMWNLIYRNTAMGMIVDKMFKKRLLVVYTISAIFGYFGQCLISQALLYFFIPPCVIYIVMRYIILPLKYHNSQGNAKGLYAFWSQNDIGRRFWVAEVDGAVIGTAAVERLSATTAEIFRSVQHCFDQS